MRRYAVLSAVILVAAVFVAAWVNAQETRRRAPRVAFSGGEYQATDTPRPLAADAKAFPIDGEPDAMEPDSAVQPAAVPAEGEPEEAAPLLARRPRISRLGPAVVPATPINNPHVQGDGEIGVEIDSPAASPNMPSVLKKKAGTPPTAALRNESRLTPTIIGSEPQDAGGSSRRAIVSPRSQSITGDEPMAAPAIAPRTTRATSQMLEIAGQSPKLVVTATGPQAVTVGKPAAYQVHVSNDSKFAAEDVVVRIGLPQWVQVRGGEGSRGEAKQEKDATGRQWLVWSLAQIPASGNEQLALELVAQQNQPFELAMQWTARPATVSGEIAVREPQVEVRLEGPSDLLFGEQKTFTLHVSNPGSGDAENVVVEVVSGGGEPNRLEVGLLAAGQQKQIPFSVGANAPGEMEIRALATAAGGLSNEAASRVLVHKPELQVAIDVPPLNFAGAEATYQVAVANVGDAVAEQVTLTIALPPGAKYVGGLDGAAKAGDGLTLKIGNLAANSEKVFDLHCVLMQAGENHFQVAAHGKGELAASQQAVTQVEALADLKLRVTEPVGPVPVGSEAVYEVRVANRGTRAAEKVKVVVQFAQGIEPFEVEGGTAAVANGQAFFEPLAQVPAGEEVLLKVKVKGEAAGSHAFRVEVKAGDPEVKLVSEGVTRCFADSAAARATARKSSLLPVPATKTR
jgi:uncharacterized repeat protein (TIGR01451 family)